MVFPGFTEADFDAYKPERAGSHAYNRPRLEVKQKALALARTLAERAFHTGTALEVSASDEHPSLRNHKSVTSQWVFLLRDADAQRHLESVIDAGRTVKASLSDPAPYFRHAFLAVYLDAVRVEVTYKIHGDATVDARNLRAVTDDPDRAAALLRALHTLPGGFSLGWADGRTDTHTLDLTSLRASVQALLAPPSTVSSGLSRNAGWWHVTRVIERDTAVARGGSLADDITAGFEALLPVYVLTAWSATNDRVFLDDELRAARERLAAKVSEDAVREAAWRARHDADIQRRRDQSEIETRERVASLEPARPSAVQAAVQTVVRAAEAPPKAMPQTVAPVPTAHKPSPVVSKPPVAPRVTAPVLVDSDAPLVAGAQVRVRTGPFAGRVGTITELDGRGNVKVAFGPMTARLSTQELVTLTAV